MPTRIISTLPTRRTTEEPIFSDTTPEGELEDEAVGDLSGAAEDDIAASGSISIGISTMTMLTKDLEKLTERSQAKMGKWLLTGHEKSWDKKLKKMEQTGRPSSSTRNFVAFWAC